MRRQPRVCVKERKAPDRDKCRRITLAPKFKFEVSGYPPDTTRAELLGFIKSHCPARINLVFGHISVVTVDARSAPVVQGIDGALFGPCEITVQPCQVISGKVALSIEQAVNERKKGEILDLSNFVEQMALKHRSQHLTFASKAFADLVGKLIKRSAASIVNLSHNKLSDVSFLTGRLLRVCLAHNQISDALRLTCMSRELIEIDVTHNPLSLSRENVADLRMSFPNLILLNRVKLGKLIRFGAVEKWAPQVMPPEFPNYFEQGTGELAKGFARQFFGLLNEKKSVDEAYADGAHISLIVKNNKVSAKRLERELALMTFDIKSFCADSFVSGELISVAIRGVVNYKTARRFHRVFLLKASKVGPAAGVAWPYVITNDQFFVK